MLVTNSSSKRRRKERIESRRTSVSIFWLQRYPEWLSYDQEKFEIQCDSCKKLQPAITKFYLSQMPNILVLHLKRFQFRDGYLEKIENDIDFPLRSFNLSKWTYGNDPSNRKVLYDLYAVANHMGNGQEGKFIYVILRPLYLLRLCATWGLRTVAKFWWWVGSDCYSAENHDAIHLSPVLPTSRILFIGDHQPHVQKFGSVKELIKTKIIYQLSQFSYNI